MQLLGNPSHNLKLSCMEVLSETGFPDPYSAVAVTSDRAVLHFKEHGDIYVSAPKGVFDIRNIVWTNEASLVSKHFKESLARKCRDIRAQASSQF